jgi:hypothetical protein
MACIPWFWPSFDFSQEEREYHIEHLQEWRDTSLKILKEFDQNQGMHAIFVSFLFD